LLRRWANAAGFDAHLALAPDRGKRFFDRNVVVPGALRPSNVAVSRRRQLEILRSRVSLPHAGNAALAGKKVSMP